jgi:hypothetical protein
VRGRRQAGTLRSQARRIFRLALQPPATGDLGYGFVCRGPWLSKGTIPWPILPLMMILSVPLMMRSMVSRYMRLRVTSGAFLYSSFRNRAAWLLASATDCVR